ncbi:hypothetical protein AU510_16370 [Lonsdalea britannica]|uniref:hypothetical protein n=1 Tax=Lonsdalea britannica TaxID=1082704 RepID=UPI000A1DC2F8|nr:hypothetical protein [Lonsdalea britannica]OSN02901.1 hypothetical protein AU510_16370 [Lonsdalea britannica]
MNTKSVVILAPVMPVWDNGEFCKPLVELLTLKGFHVSVIDSLPLLENADPESAVKNVCLKLKSCCRTPFLLVGFAMAGTLVQMLSHQLDCLKGVMSISAPGFADDLLQERIGHLVSLLEKGEVDHAIEVLHQFVVPEGHMAPQGGSPLPNSLKQSATDRMIRGFSLLLNMDARTHIAQYPGKFLAIVGEKSQLATWDNQTHSANPEHTYVSIPGAGMRPWNDNASAMDALVNRWIEEL